MNEIPYYDGTNAALITKKKSPLSLASTVGSAWDLDDNFSSDLGWVTAGSAGNQINTSTSKLEFFLQKIATVEGLSFDCGAGNISDTSWLIRMYKIRWSTIHNSTLCYWGFHEHPVDTQVMFVGDFLGFEYLEASVPPDFVGVMSMDESVTASDTTSQTLSTATDYYVEIRRLTATTSEINVYTDEFVTLLATTSHTLLSTVAGLRYLRMSPRSDKATGEDQVGTIDRIRAMFSQSTPP